MAIKRNIQLRLDASNGEIKQFTLGSTHYVITGMSNKKNLLPDTNMANPFWTHRQYTAVDANTKEKFEIYVYYYTSVESKKYAVVQSIEKV